ncbi:MAG: YraN family protein [Bacteroidales bacterium]|nr:YraN family protein [Bacteroidales bacterium]
MRTEKQLVGQKGEDLAAEFYRKNNYIILDRNWKCYHLEVDLVALNEEYLVFCEVKTRSYTAFGEPETFVTTQKQKNLIRAANMYLTRKNISKEVRFDIISIVICGEEYQIHHIPNAFQPRW